MPKYRLIVDGDTLAEIAGAVTEAAQYLQNADLGEQLAGLADPPRPNGAEQAPLPLPPPDYAGAGLTAHQAAQAQAAAPSPYLPHTAYSQANPPVCRVHLRPMAYIGAELSKAGKQRPVWSCNDRACREAVWLPRE